MNNKKETQGLPSADVVLKPKHEASTSNISKENEKVDKVKDGQQGAKIETQATENQQTQTDDKQLENTQTKPAEPLGEAKIQFNSVDKGLTDNLSTNMKLQVERLTQQLDSPPPQPKKIHVRRDASDLIVISRMRDLLKYVLTATKKIPKSQRLAFTNRIQQLAVNSMECMVRANFIVVKPGKLEQLKKRHEFQEKAFCDLKVLEYLVAIAVEEEFMLLKQYKQIAKQGTEVSILLTKWMESDKRRFLTNKN